jgi:hypothetical protein
MAFAVRRRSCGRAIVRLSQWPRAWPHPVPLTQRMTASMAGLAGVRRGLVWWFT